MPGLDFSKIPMDLILNIINIILIFVIVKTLLYKPVKNFLDARAKKTADAIKEAQDAKDAAHKLKSDYDSLLADSEVEVKKLIKDGEIKAAEKSAAIIENARKQAEEIIAEAHKQIEEDRREAQEDIKKEIVRTALIISEKVLEREIKDTDVRKVAEEYFVNPKGKIV
ncbi:MAG: ATP synthase F0 subunit B [Ruminococcaceae bacterium]|nr:ATP synthase F0 subunit B [Oscillospiraceae bacterium]